MATGQWRVKGEGKVNLYSRRGKSFNRQYPHIVEAVADLPGGTVIERNPIQAAKK